MFGKGDLKVDALSSIALAGRNGSSGKSNSLRSVSAPLAYFKSIFRSAGSATRDSEVVLDLSFVSYV